jgi:hypothetical protein
MAAKLSNIDLQKLVSGLQLLKNEVADARAEKIPDNPSWLWRMTHLEPSVYAGSISAIVLILGAVGLVISGKDVSAITGGVAAAIGIVQAVWTRKKVTANAKVVVYKPDPVGAPTKVSAGDAVSSDAVAVVNAAGVDSNPMSAHAGPILPFTYPGVS